MELSKTVFVTDLDGTLLTTDKRITDEDSAAIERYRRLGGHFGIATGRPIQTTVRYLENLPCDIPLILYNGCIVYDHCKDKILYASYLPEVAKTILTDVRESFPDISPEIFTFEDQYYFHLNDAERWHQSILGIEYTKLESHLQITEPWCKMLFADEPEVITCLEDYVKKYDGKGVRFVRSCPKFLEVLPLDASKGAALDIAVDLAGYRGLFIAAAGDYDNDIELIKAADLGFCPSSSQECVKAEADVVLESSNDCGAVAEALKFLENK